MHIVLHISTSKAIWRGNHVKLENSVVACNDIVNYHKKDFSAQNVQYRILQLSPDLHPVHIILKITMGGGKVDVNPLYSSLVVTNFRFLTSISPNMTPPTSKDFMYRK